MPQIKLSVTVAKKIRRTTMAELLTNDSRLILAFIRDHPGMTRIEIITNLQMNSFDVAMALKQLKYHGMIVRIKSEEGPDFKVRYYLG